ncbi:hypothetical protein BV25DRAFT_574018 [Artomyces pyxidatus]|uniref:Uncharacterized protein n=1 Tax=Artomyces pyxidatus TaxID=48021 RepID=A0ACB8TJ21_9AGAM|nr:hypothetical protein BV25DRAFT_574018 [Artomyces pyxidatus]
MYPFHDGSSNGVLAQRSEVRRGSARPRHYLESSYHRPSCRYIRCFCLALILLQPFPCTFCFYSCLGTIM